MSRDEKDRVKGFQSWLDALYQPLFKQWTNTGETLDKFEDLHRANDGRIDRSLDANIDTYRQNLEQIEKEHAKQAKAIDETFDKKRKGLEKADETINRRHAERLAEIEEVFEQKRSHCTLKDEKTQVVYERAIKAAEEDTLRKQTDAESMVDEAIERHNANITELMRENNIKHAVNDNRLQLARVEYDVAHAKLEKDIESKLEAIKQERSQLESDYKTQVADLEKTRRRTLAPHDEGIRKLKSEHKAERERLESELEEATNKQRSYKKEAEKLGDQQTIDRVEKKLKEIRRDHRDKKRSCSERQNQELEEKKHQRDEAVKQIDDQLLELKAAFLQSLSELLKRKHHLETENFIQLDETNTAFNLADSRHRKDRRVLELENDVQTLNINRALEEAREENDYLTKRSKPEGDLEINEAWLQHKLDETDHQRTLEVARAKRSRDETEATITRDLRLKENDIARRRLQHKRSYDLEHLEIQKALRIYNQDYENEQTILDHFLKYAKNHNALKNEYANAHRPDFDAESDQRTQLRIERFEAMQEDARRQHENIVARIETISARERNLHLRAYEEVQTASDASLERLKEQHETTARQDMARLESLHPRRDRRRIARIRKENEEREASRQRAYEERKRELRERIRLHEDMLKSIDEKRRQSLEEAKTLLNHALDELDNLIADARRQAEEEKQRLQRGFEEIKRRASLFNSFQKDRREETLQQAKTYLNARIHRMKNRKSRLDNRHQTQLDALETEWQAYSSDVDKRTREMEAQYQQALEDLESEHQKRQSQLKEAHEEESRRLRRYMEHLGEKHDTALEEIKERTEQEITRYFEEKSRLEREYEAESDRLEKAHARFVEEKRKEEEAFAGEINRTMEKLHQHIAKQPASRMRSREAASLVPLLLGERSLETSQGSS